MSDSVVEEKSYSYNISRIQYIFLIPLLILAAIYNWQKILSGNFHTRILFFGYANGSPALLYMLLEILIFLILILGCSATLINHWKKNCRIVLDDQALYVVNGNDFENAEDFIAYTAMYRISVVDLNGYQPCAWKKDINLKIECSGVERFFSKSRFDSDSAFEDLTSELYRRSGLKKPSEHPYKRK